MTDFRAVDPGLTRLTGFFALPPSQIDAAIVQSWFGFGSDSG